VAGLHGFGALPGQRDRFTVFSGLMKLDHSVIESLELGIGLFAG
jgi:hypothetical protein